MTDYYDRFGYPADLDEWRSAVRSMSETQRVQACGHSARNGRVCPDCGEEVDRG